MIELTAPDHSKIRIDGSHVLKARAAFTREEPTNTAQTRIDWVTIAYVLEPLETVVPLIQTELRSFTSLTTREGAKQWFDAKQAKGPLPLAGNSIDNVVKSAIKVGDQRIMVTETPQQVAAVITAAGGDPLPIPGTFSAFVTSVIDKVRSAFGAKPDR